MRISVKSGSDVQIDLWLYRLPMPGMYHNKDVAMSDQVGVAVRHIRAQMARVALLLRGDKVETAARSVVFESEDFDKLIRAAKEIDDDVALTVLTSDSPAVDQDESSSSESEGADAGDGNVQINALTEQLSENFEALVQQYNDLDTAATGATVSASIDVRDALYKYLAGTNTAADHTSSAVEKQLQIAVATYVKPKEVEDGSRSKTAKYDELVQHTIEIAEQVVQLRGDASQHFVTKAKRYARGKALLYIEHRVAQNGARWPNKSPHLLLCGKQRHPGITTHARCKMCQRKIQELKSAAKSLAQESSQNVEKETNTSPRSCGITVKKHEKILVDVIHELSAIDAHMQCSEEIKTNIKSGINDWWRQKRSNHKQRLPMWVDILTKVSYKDGQDYVDKFNQLCSVAHQETGVDIKRFRVLAKMFIAATRVRWMPTADLHALLATRGMDASISQFITDSARELVFRVKLDDMFDAIKTVVDTAVRQKQIQDQSQDEDE